MRRLVPSLSAIVLACASTGTVAQVYRCGSSSVYTDKPCDGASAVDVRANILDAGPRQVPPDATPAGAPAIIMQAAPKRPEPSGSMWGRRDAAEAEHRGRTGPFRP